MDDETVHKISFNMFLKKNAEQSRIYKGKSPFLNLNSKIASAEQIEDWSFQ